MPPRKQITNKTNMTVLPTTEQPISEPPTTEQTIPSKKNIILHLKCTSAIQHTSIEGFSDFTFTGDFMQNISSFNDDGMATINTVGACECTCNVKELWKKLTQLEISYHLNTLETHKSSCFWCTYNFPGPSIYIPRSFKQGKYNVYGCFCSPECAAAYLMKENIDRSTKLERFTLLNNLYGSVYEYTDSIRCAGDPRLLLRKFTGTMSIEEFRAISQYGRTTWAVEKPFTRVMPELLVSNLDSVAPRSTYQVRRPQPKQSKAAIIQEKFGGASLVATN